MNYLVTSNGRYKGLHKREAEKVKVTWCERDRTSHRRCEGGGRRHEPVEEGAMSRGIRVTS